MNTAENIEPTVSASQINLAVATPAPTSHQVGLGKGGEEGKRAATPLPPFAKLPGQNVRTLGVEGDDIYTPAPTVNPVIASLRSMGLYGEEAAPGQHAIICPWASEHGNAETSAIYFAPTTSNPLGRFRCTHPHSEGRSVKHLLDHVAVLAKEARCQPEIFQAVGELPRIVSAAERVLAAAGKYYQSGGRIVALKIDPTSGDATIEPLNDASLAVALSACAYWTRFDGRAQKIVRSDPTDKVVKSLLRADHYQYLPNLNGIARQPFFRKSDGKLIGTSGYDATSGILGWFNSNEFDLPDPTRGNAEAAADLLASLVSEFHFDTEVDRSAALCAMLTATVRTSLPLAPAFNISACASGSGKSCLGATIAPFAGRGMPMNVSYPTTAEEATKAMQSILMTQPAVVMFDDMQTDWLAHGAINRTLTSEYVTDRVLGSSMTATLPTSSFFMGTGNNVQPVRDMARRVVSIYLDPKNESPATIRYNGDPVETVRANRGKYVGAALTIIAAYKTAGSPDQNLPPIGSYGTWSDMCRAPLVWLGLPDPASSLIAQVTSDPDAENHGNFLEEVRAHFPDRSFTIRQLMERSEDFDELKDAITELPVAERGVINRSRLGWYMKKNLRRTASGLQIHKGDSSERNSWKVVRLDDRPDRVTPSSPPSYGQKFTSVPRGIDETDVF